jgi:histidinol-phosphate aminotransferase
MIRPKKSVENMQPYNPPLEGRRDYIRLDFNENTIGPCKEVLEAIKNVNPNEISSYPEYEKFRKKLADYLEIKKSELCITNASDEAIKLVIDTYMEQDEEIIIPVPAFPMFKFYAQVAGVKIKEILYNDDLSFPTEKIVNSISSKTKIIVIVSPNSPTGTSVSDEDIKKIIGAAPNSIILLDEAYCQYSGNSLKKWISKCPNLVIIQTFSKAFGLAGLRLGYIISSKENIKSLSKANSPYSVNTLAMIAASKAIEKSNYIDCYVNEVKESRKLLKEFLEGKKIRFYGSAANFILISFGDKAKFIGNELRKKGILVRGQSEKALLKGCIRVTLGTKEQTRQLIEALAGVL